MAKAFNGTIELTLLYPLTGRNLTQERTNKCDYRSQTTRCPSGRYTRIPKFRMEAIDHVPIRRSYLLSYETLYMNSQVSYETVTRDVTTK